MTKVKSRHEKEVQELKSEIQKSRTCIEKLSSELYNLNEKQLDVQKENEFLKTRLRHVENAPSISGRPSLPMAAKLMGKIPGKPFYGQFQWYTKNANI